MKKTSCRFLIFTGIMFFLCLLVLSTASARQITGKVIQADEQTVTITVDGNFIPEKGDPVTLFLEHEMLGRMKIGTWEITAVEFPQVTAVKKEATGNAESGVKAVIDSAAPKPLVEQKEKAAVARPDPIRSKADEELISAAEKGSLPDTRAALQKGANPNAAQDSGGFPLALAAHEGHLEIASELLKAGANPNLEDTSGRTPLGMAAYKGNDDILQLLVKNGALINYASQPDAKRFAGATALCMAAGENQIKTVQLLLSLGADPLIEDSIGENALGYAVQSRNLDMINIFLNQGVPVTASASTGFSPLHAAAEWSAGWGIMAYLIGAGADVNARIKKTDRLPALFHGVTPLIISAANIEDRQVLLLLQAGADPSIRSDRGNTALDEFMAVKKQRLEKDPNLPEWYAKSMDRIEKALSDPVKGKQMAIQFLTEEMVDAVRDNKVTTLVALDAIGMDLSHALKDQKDLLADAITEGRFPMARLLLKHGADPLARGEEGKTPFIASVYRGDVELAKRFYEAGADPNDIPWGAGVGMIQMVYKYSLGDRMEMIRWLISIGADVNWLDEDENTPLHMAAENEDLPLFELLIDSGANPRIKNEKGESAFELVPDPKKQDYIKILNKVWPPTSMLVKSIEHLEPVLEKAEKNKDWPLFRKTAKELIDLGDSRGYYAMGRICYHGLGEEINLKSALNYFKQGAQIEPVEPDIYNAMGACYLNGVGGLKADREKAVEWFEKGISKGSLKAAYHLGLMYLEGSQGINKDPLKAYILIQRAAVQGRPYPDAVYKLGYLYENGIGIPKDEKTAKKLYEEAEDLGYVKEQAAAPKMQTRDGAPGNIGLDDLFYKAFHRVFNKEPGWQEQFKILEQHTAKGNMDAMGYLGSAYFSGIGEIPKDMEKGKEMCSRSMAAGSKIGEACMGYIYQAGKNVNQDYLEAMRLFKSSASKGFAPAFYNVGKLYFDGLGTPRDDSTAFEWFKKGESRGDLNSIFAVGYCYENGYGVQKDTTQAVVYYRKAHERGHSWAKGRLKALGIELD